MTTVTYRNDVTVLVDDIMGNDAKVIRMAKASIKKLGSDMSGSAKHGFINFLMRERHGVPFEHCSFTFYLEVPILVQRQLVKHRISSISEESARYRELEPVFYLADRDRHLVQVGKPGAYTFEPGTDAQYAEYRERTQYTCQAAWSNYKGLLRAGVARELARSVLPTSVYTSAYMTVNLRSLMNLLSLRTAEENATIKGHPQHEIELVAKQMEYAFASAFPYTYETWNENGRVAP